MPFGLFRILANRGPSLFSNWNAKLAIFDIKRGCIGMKRGTIGPWAYPEGKVLSLFDSCHQGAEIIYLLERLIGCFGAL